MTVLVHPQSQTTENSNASLAKQVLEEIISLGVREFCLCPGARNAPLIYPLVHSTQVKLYHWPEERSAAFFALGRIKATGAPVCVVTTSGTAAAELLPAVMEAYYSGLPLVLLTADRPRRFRGTGAPQSAEQVGLFGCYAPEMYDLQSGEVLSLKKWSAQTPLHLNLCFEEPSDNDCQQIRVDHCPVRAWQPPAVEFSPDERYLSFMHRSHFPLVVVGGLHSSQQEAAVNFLRHLQAPVYLEGISGLREDPRLEPLRLTGMEDIWKFSAQHAYPIDGILRLGTIPTHRLWRDVENKGGKIPVCSISELPFSGLSFADVIQTHLPSFFAWAATLKPFHDYPYLKWKQADIMSQQKLLDLFQEEPLAEQSLIHALSKKIPAASKIYLGNSLPIREWDLGATYASRHFKMACSRGLNGIDGQIATFLGFSSPEQQNWAILGDLTVLYDLVAPWISSQMPAISTNLVLVNNGGAGIFARMFAYPAFQHTHALSFCPLADFWKWRYERWEAIPDEMINSQGGSLIELVPNPPSTARFLKRLKDI